MVLFSFCAELFLVLIYSYSYPMAGILTKLNLKFWILSMSANFCFDIMNIYAKLISMHLTSLQFLILDLNTNFMPAIVI